VLTTVYKIYMTNQDKTQTRDDYVHFLTIPTRWIDNDIYAHVNNAVYYTFFDTVINHYLIEAGGLDPVNGDLIGLAVETFCQFFAPIAFPDIIDAGLRVGKLGNSSVRYEVGLFKRGAESAAAAGHFVHVFVDAKSRKPQTITGQMRVALEKLLVNA